MYHTITPVISNHDPIIIEGGMETQILMFNAGPSTIEAQVWKDWKGKENGNYLENSNEPNFKLELRAGNQKIISGSFIRIAIKDDKIDIANKQNFAAVGSRILFEKEFYL
jgi:hypothetical protein